ncbi:glycoside hydrolase family 36 protein [Ophiostoma piceae UAMH 11346]|uniref:Glycoside hydrolase family 36 protein n=1 Tax=Ophiostoma piceae (strain UAMH 11346) TaxID=1262450 RepID=S3BVL5_OPHP1|nr:glycoside hydrolase family 36 protein [Ophiostoma piceae UAMH 11346]
MTQEYSFAKEFAATLPRKKAIKVRRTVAVAGKDQSKMGAAVSVATYPPLGQVTQVADSQVTFYAVAEVKEGENKEAPEVVLWHSPTGQAEDVDGEDPGWTAVPFELIEAGGEVPRNSMFWSLQKPDTDVARHRYRTIVNTNGRLLNFTVKFRQATSSDSSSSEAHSWSWVGDEQQISDGTVVINARTKAVPIPFVADAAVDAADIIDTDSTPLGDLVGGLNPAFRVTTPRSQAPGTQLWCLEAPVAGVADSDPDTPSTYTRVPIGTPWNGDFLRWFALVRIWTPWLAPRHGRESLTGQDLDDDAMLCSFLSAEGRHLVFLAISGVDHLQTVIHGDGETANKIVLDVRSDSLKTETATILVASGDSFEAANAAVMYHARSLVHQMGAAGTAEPSLDPVEKQCIQDEKDIQTLSDEVKPEWLEDWYDGLGFCTWNGLGQNLTEDKIVAAVNTLAEHGIQIATLIIDDNWQSIDRSHTGGQFQYSMSRFEADPQQFPNGLGRAIARVREAQRSIRHIAVWHALLGYWGGITPAEQGGEIAKQYKTLVIDRDHPKRRNLPIAGPMTVVDEPDVRRFYNDFYDFLRDSGVDAVKTDAQFMMDAWTSAAARRTLTSVYQDAWTIATLRHFGSRAVSCMSQTPNILFYSQMPQNRPAVLVRNSDDFFPDVPASHPWHVWTNAHNSLFTQHLNVLPDWDMFQTVHGYSGFHAAARCISGGPIYITDKPGEHDLDLLGQMTARGMYGNTVIFRPSVVGRAIDQYVGFHDNVLLKVGSYHGNSEGTGILGVFNVSERAVHELLPLARVPGVVSDALYIVRAHSSGRVTAPVHADALLTVSLDVYGYEILSAYRIHSFQLASEGTKKEVHVANLGLVGKMAAAATLASTSFKQRADNGRIEMQTALKAPGVMGLYVSGLAEGRVTVADNFLVTIRSQPIPAHCVGVSAQDSSVLEIDAARAWDELGFTPMLNNELQLTVYISV